TVRAYPRPRKACVRMRGLTLRVSQRGGIRLRSAAIYLNGRLARRVSGEATTGVIVLAHVPAGSFTLKVVATSTRGQTFTTRRFFPNCQSARCARLVLALHGPGHSRIVAVDAYVNGRKVRT